MAPHERLREGCARARAWARAFEKHYAEDLRRLCGGDLPVKFPARLIAHHRGSLALRPTTHPHRKRCVRPPPTMRARGAAPRATKMFRVPPCRARCAFAYTIISRLYLPYLTYYPRYSASPGHIGTHTPYPHSPDLRAAVHHCKKGECGRHRTPSSECDICVANERRNAILRTLGKTRELWALPGYPFEETQHF